MIVDSMRNAALYYGVCPRMQRAFELLADVDLEALAEGKHTLDGDEIFVNIMERDLKRPEDAKLEVHNRYADIQILLVGNEELFGWTDRAELTDPVGEFDEAKDVLFHNDAHQFTYSIRKGQFTILMPEDGHAPMIGEGRVKKAIVKVLI